MMQSNEALIIIVLLLLFGFSNVFFGREIFRPLLLVYGFASGAVLVGIFANYTNTEASVLGVIIVGAIFALLSYVVFYLGIAILGAGVGVLLITMIASILGSEPAPLLLLATVALCGGLAVAFHDYVLMFATALGGSLMIAQAIYLFFPNTKARFNFIDGLQFIEVSNAAKFIGAMITIILTILGAYMQWKSYSMEHQHQD